MKRSGPDDANRTTRGYLKFAHVGTQFALFVAGGVLGGWWLDGKLGVTPLFTLIGTLVGSGYGFFVLYRTVYPGRSRGGQDDDGSASSSS